MKPPKLVYNKIKLPLTNLHYVTCGKGEPLIMVPATISEIDNWTSLIQYMGTRFKVHFFELPGHGQSSAFKPRFNSDLVAKSVEDFVDAMGYKRFNIMGFSFGGILTMKTLYRLRNRIDKVILFAPCVTHRALTHNKVNLFFIKTLAIIMKSKFSQKIMLKIMHNEFTVDGIIWILRNIGHVETLGVLRKKLLRLKPSTLDVLVYQINEILNAEFNYKPFKQKLYFGMSIYDPLLDYKTTLDTLKKLFHTMNVQEFDFPFHQPPKPFTFEELTTDFAEFRDIIKQNES